MVGMIVGPITPASANDFEIHTRGGGGSIEFIDHGPGRPGGGSNDDYFLIHDYKADGHGVWAWVWLDGVGHGAKYNGRGKAAAPVFWDPIEVLDGWFDKIKVQVCLADGNNVIKSTCSNVYEHFESD
jgi:hypothetical protein